MTEWIYRHYKLGVFLIEGIVGANALLILGPTGVPYTTICLLLIAAVAPWIVLHKIVSGKLGERAMYALNEECDPEPMLELAGMALEQFDRRGKSRQAQVLSWRLNRVVALTCLGKHREALNELDHVQSRLPRKPGEFHLLCHNNRAAVAGSMGRAEEMEAELKQVQTLAAQIRIHPNLAMAVELALRTNCCALRALREGYGPEVEKELRAMMEMNPSVRWQVGVHLGLARCALERGDRTEAREHLNYVRDHGNKLEARRKAEDLMTELN